MCIELQSRRSWVFGFFFSVGPTVLCSAHALFASSGNGHVVIDPAPELGTVLVAHL